MHIYSPSNLEGDYLSIGYYLNGKQGDWMISGCLVEMDENYGCDVEDANLLGKIAAVTKLGKIFYRIRRRRYNSLASLLFI
jgi:hypothetical protein